MRLSPLAWVLIAVAARAQNAPAPPFPAPGRLIDLGEGRLHLNCSGQANPSRAAVILEAGAGDFSVDWSLVQPLVAPFARACSYDRAGAGSTEREICNRCGNFEAGYFRLSYCAPTS